MFLYQEYLSDVTICDPRQNCNTIKMVKGAASQNGRLITPGFINGRFDDHAATNIIILHVCCKVLIRHARPYGHL